jgi:hypothetical protein
MARLKHFPLLLVLLSGSWAAAQETVQVIPQTVFVGDRARLVAPLHTDAEPFVLEAPELSGNAIVIHRIELERWDKGARLLIDFTAYRPGILDLPPLAILEKRIPGQTPAGLQVSIASILEGDSLVLSEPAPPLPVPGTTILIYGSFAALILMFLLVLGFRLWSRENFKHLLERFRRRALIRMLGKALRQIRKDLATLDTRKSGDILTRLSGEFRNFLSLLLGMNCHAMAAGEFLDLPPLTPPSASISSASIPSASIPINKPEPMAPKPEPLPEPLIDDEAKILSGSFICGVFRRFDTLRFSGTGIERAELLGILDELLLFTDTLDRAERKSQTRSAA